MLMLGAASVLLMVRFLSKRRRRQRHQHRADGKRAARRAQLQTKRHRPPHSKEKANRWMCGGYTRSCVLRAIRRDTVERTGSERGSRPRVGPARSTVVA